MADSTPDGSEYADPTRPYGWTVPGPAETPPGMPQPPPFQSAPPFQPPPFQPPPFQSAPPYGSGSYSAPFPGGPFTVYPAPQASNGLAVAALIVSLCGFFCVGFAGLAAIGLGTAGYRQSLRSGVGRGMSIAAISIGIFWVLATIMLAAVLMAARRQ